MDKYNIRHKLPPTGDIERIQDKLKEIKKIFDDFFDKPWLLSAIDRSDLPHGFIREVRLYVDGKDFYFDEPVLIKEGLEKIYQFLTVVDEQILPNLKDILGLSVFREQDKNAKPDESLIRKFTNITFPHNVNSLHEKTDELRDLLDAIYPGMFRKS